MKAPLNLTGFVLYTKVFYLLLRWNLVDLLIVIFSLAGIIIQALSLTRRFLINPSVARTFRVLRIIRGLLIKYFCIDYMKSVGRNCFLLL